jgi:acetyl esterase/lipase
MVVVLGRGYISLVKHIVGVDKTPAVGQMSPLFMKRLLPSLLLLSICLSTPAQPSPDYKRSEDIIYGRKFGTALTLDVFQPAKPNGAGLVLIVSGGFFSSHEAINVGFCRVFLERGYTVFAVVHGSQPKFIIPEIEQDLHRAVRFIRHNAATYSVDPNSSRTCIARCALSGTTPRPTAWIPTAWGSSGPAPAAT